MKTLLFSFLIATFFFSFSAQAQLSFGIKSSVNKAWFGQGLNPFSRVSDAQLNRLGVAVEVYYNTGKHFSFGAEPGMVQRGAVSPLASHFYGFCGTGIDFTMFPYNNASIYSDYVQLPVFAKYRFTLLKNKLELSTKLGPGVSYAVSGYQQTDEFTRSSPSDITPIEFGQNAFKRWDIGLHGGIGLGWRFCFGTVTLETEVYRGMKSIHASYFGLKNQSYGYSLGYRLDL